MGQALDGFSIAKKLIEAGIIPKDLAVRRIVIDVQVDEPVSIYYETYADKVALDICVESLMANKKDLNIKQMKG